MINGVFVLQSIPTNRHQRLQVLSLSFRCLHSLSRTVRAQHSPRKPRRGTGRLLTTPDTIYTWQSPPPTNNRARLRTTTHNSSRKMRVLAHFTIHVVEIIQLYTDQPYMWLEHGHHPCSNHMYGWTQSRFHRIFDEMYEMNHTVVRFSGAFR